eukprot:gene12748-23206_t
MMESVSLDDSVADGGGRLSVVSLSSDAGDVAAAAGSASTMEPMAELSLGSSIASPTRASSSPPPPAAAAAAAAPPQGGDGLAAPSITAPAEIIPGAAGHWTDVTTTSGVNTDHGYYNRGWNDAPEVDVINAKVVTKRKYDYKAAAGNTGASTGLLGGAVVDASAPPMMPPTIQTTTAGGAAAPTVGAAPVEGMMAPPTIPVVPGAVFTPGAAAVTTMFTPSAPVTADAPPPVTEGAVSATPLTPVATANLAAPTGHQLAYQDLPANGFKRIETPSLASAGDSAALVGVLTAVVAKLDGGRTKKRVLDDIAKRVESLKQAIANNSLSATVRTLVGDLVAALSEEQYDIAKGVHLTLAQRHTSEVAAWSTGVKRLIHELVPAGGGGSRPTSAGAAVTTSVVPPIATVPGAAAVMAPATMMPLSPPAIGSGYKIDLPGSTTTAAAAAAAAPMEPPMPAAAAAAAVSQPAMVPMPAPGFTPAPVADNGLGYAAAAAAAIPAAARRCYGRNDASARYDGAAATAATAKQQQQQYQQQQQPQPQQPTEGVLGEVERTMDRFHSWASNWLAPSSAKDVLSNIGN